MFYVAPSQELMGNTFIFNQMKNYNYINHSVNNLIRLGVDYDSIVVVGSTVLETLGLRKAGDLDFALNSEAYEHISKLHGNGVALLRSGTINITEDTQILRNRYKSVGITDDQLFNDPDLTFLLDGIRFARPELEFGKKLFRNQEKDRNDVILLQRFASRDPGWRWDLIPTSPTKKDILPHTKRIGKFDRLKSLSLRAIKDPAHVIRAFSVRLKRSGLPRNNRQRNSTLRPPGLTIPVVDVGTLMQWQFVDTQFTRYDTLLRLKSALDYLRGDQQTLSSRYKIGEYSSVFSDYEIMQTTRVNRNTTLRFQELLESIRRKGFHTDRYPISLSAGGHLLDGSHRLACAIAWGVERVPVEFTKRKDPASDYGREWFIEHGFDSELIARLDELLTTTLIETGAAFQLIIWPPAKAFASEIIATVRERYRVLSVVQDVEVRELGQLVDEMYLSDDIERWKIQKKIFHMKEYEPSISVVSFLIDRPAYRTKSRTQSYLSDAVASLKAELRKKYRHHIPNYVHDIILHIGDNPAMNRDMFRTLKKHGVMLLKEDTLTYQTPTENEK